MAFKSVSSPQYVTERLESLDLSNYSSRLDKPLVVSVDGNLCCTEQNNVPGLLQNGYFSLSLLGMLGKFSLIVNMKIPGGKTHKNSLRLGLQKSLLVKLIHA